MRRPRLVQEIAKSGKHASAMMCVCPVAMPVMPVVVPVMPMMMPVVPMVMPVVPVMMPVRLGPRRRERQAHGQ